MPSNIPFGKTPTLTTTSYGQEFSNILTSLNYYANCMLPVFKVLVENFYNNPCLDTAQCLSIKYKQLADNIYKQITPELIYIKACFT